LLDPISTAAAGPKGADGAALRPRPRQLSDVLFIACGLSWAVGLIHVVAAAQHLEEYVLYAVFFDLLAVAQFAWGFALYRSPSRRLLHLGAAMSLGVVALWIASRTTGLPIGPEPWTPESIGTLDLIATADELVLTVLIAFELRAARRSSLGRVSRQLATAMGLCLILLSSLAATLPAHGH
jgi:hypothetical protein